MDRKNQLIDIALELFATNGFEGTKISDIVAAADVSQGTFYWYFKSKESIVIEIILLSGKELLQVVGQGYRTTGGTVQDSVDASRNLFVQLFTFAEKNRYFMEILCKGMHFQPAIQQELDAIRSDIHHAFTKNIKRARELQILPDITYPERKAAFLLSLVEGVITRWLIDQEKGESTFEGMTPEELAEEMVTFEFYGLMGI
ncbi:TetR/AcrR family transcriptional regulator [Sporosarcina sp. GW1-11]|uniref:TetR/AcrR family transcriptional regulator n=1 Tax=Sporosarcina sp. GW1-11 TaxID=2899126 RepID=UPI002953D24C|nr:TetR/AcrR family transcriptional regulator [Sporosarcina sp. GW1-11]